MNENQQRWITVIGTIVAAVIPLLVAYGVLTSEMGELWKGVIMAIVAAVVPVVIGSLIKNHNDNETIREVVAQESETARLNLEIAQLRAK